MTTAAVPKITVYIPSRNYGRFLGEAVESVLRQKRADWELLIIDDRSDDDTARVMALYRGDPRIRLFETPGIGLPSVCNLALREARGEYVIRLDGDDIFDENILLVLAGWLDADPSLALAFPDYYLMDEFGEVYAHGTRDPVTGKAPDMPPHGACTLVRKALLVEAGGYREDLGAQDGFDLWTKLSSRHKTTNVNLPLFFYRRHGANVTNDRTRILSARRQIKKDAIEASLAAFRPLIAVIPCRENYDFERDVWSLEVGGTSLLERAIRSCLASSILDTVVVTSDNSRVTDVMARFSDARLKFHPRPSSETLRSKSITATLGRVAAEYDPRQAGLTVLCYVQSAFVTTGTLEEAISTVAINRADSAIGVEEIGDPIYKRGAGGLAPVNPPRNPSTEFDKVYREASVALASCNRNLASGSLTGTRIANFVVPAAESFFIDTQQKLRIARILAGEP